MNGSTFNRPNYPVYLPVIPDVNTETTTRDFVQQHKVHKTQFNTTKACYDVLKKKILSEFHNDYVELVDNINVDFAQTTTLELINHLYNS